jgi:hypothetical protein
MHLLKLILLLTFLIFSTGVITAGISINGADAILNVSVVPIDISTPPTPYAGIYVNGEDALLSPSLHSVNIDTPPTPYSGIYLSGEDAVLSSSLQSVNIDTPQIPYAGIFVSGEDSVYNYSLQSVNIDTPETPYHSLYIVGEDSVYNYSLQSVNIDTPETPYHSLYIVGEDSVYNYSLQSVNIDTPETPYHSLYVHGEDSITTNDLLVSVVQFDHIGNKTVNETEELKFTILASDLNGNAVTYSASDLPTGATFDAATATFNWTPTFEQAGVYNVTFNATANGASDSETVNITVVNVDRSPVLASIGANQSMRVSCCNSTFQLQIQMVMQ